MFSGAKIRKNAPNICQPTFKPVVCNFKKILNEISAKLTLQMRNYLESTNKNQAIRFHHKQLTSYQRFQVNIWRATPQHIREHSF